MSSNEDRDQPAIIAATGRFPPAIRLVARGLDVRDGPADKHQGDDGGWETMATFVIEFQRATGPQTSAHRSLAHHMESAETSQWLGIVTGPLLSWMLGRLVRGDESDSGADDAPS